MFVLAAWQKFLSGILSLFILLHSPFVFALEPGEIPEKIPDAPRESAGCWKIFYLVTRPIELIREANSRVQQRIGELHFADGVTTHPIAQKLDYTRTGKMTPTSADETVNTQIVRFEANGKEILRVKRIIQQMEKSIENYENGIKAKESGSDIKETEPVFPTARVDKGKVVQHDEKAAPFPLDTPARVEKAKSLLKNEKAQLKEIENQLYEYNLEQALLYWKLREVRNAFESKGVEERNRLTTLLDPKMVDGKPTNELLPDAQAYDIIKSAATWNAVVRAGSLQTLRHLSGGAILFALGKVFKPIGKVAETVVGKPIEMLQMKSEKPLKRVSYVLTIAGLLTLIGIERGWNALSTKWENDRLSDVDRANKERDKKLEEDKALVIDATPRKMLRNLGDKYKVERYIVDGDDPAVHNPWDVALEFLGGERDDFLKVPGLDTHRYESDLEKGRSYAYHLVDLWFGVRSANGKWKIPPAREFIRERMYREINDPATSLWEQLTTRYEFEIYDRAFLRARDRLYALERIGVDEWNKAHPDQHKDYPEHGIDRESKTDKPDAEIKGLGPLGKMTIYGVPAAIVAIFALNKKLSYGKKTSESTTSSGEAPPPAN